MSSETTYSEALARFGELCDEVTSTREAVIIHRRGAEDVALVAASELQGLIETSHLLRSPKNAQRLLTALVRANGDELPTSSIETTHAVDIVAIPDFLARQKAIFGDRIVPDSQELLDLMRADRF